MPIAMKIGLFGSRLRGEAIDTSWAAPFFAIQYHLLFEPCIMNVGSSIQRTVARRLHNGPRARPCIYLGRALSINCT
jgi:hypothetical protein